jgi:copper chaperone NosL
MTTEHTHADDRASTETQGLECSRRRLLGVTTAGALVALAGCLGGDDEDVPDPVALDEGQSCDQCNMVIDRHPGPAGQAFYLDDPPEELPEGRENGIARFCSSWCTYTYIFRAAENGPEPAGSYLTDYSSVEYAVSEEGGASVITAHLDAAAFAPAEQLTYAVDSNVQGSMGGSLVGFTNADDADAFVDEYGGVVVPHEDITQETVASL